MQLNPDFIEELKRRNDIESIVSSYVNLKHRGRNAVGLCPFHSEKTGSFVLYPETESYYCFGCGSGGDVITFIMNIEHLDYIEAVKFLAEKAGMQLPEGDLDDQTGRVKSTTLAINREAARYFYRALRSPAGKAGLDYMMRRGVTKDVLDRYWVGFAPDSWNGAVDHLRGQGFTKEQLLQSGICGLSRKGSPYIFFRNRVIFPIVDIRGNIIAFGGRTVGGDERKYVNSPDTPVYKKTSQLYNLNNAKTAKDGFFILCEGYMDAISVSCAGFDNVVATCGTALTGEQARLMARYTPEAALSYDSDEAGQKATRKAISLLKEAGLRVRVLQYEGAKDPDEFIKKFGVDRFRLVVKNAADSTAFQLQSAAGKYDLTTDAGRVDYLNESVRLLAGLQSPIERDVFLSRLSKDLDVSRQSIEETLRRYLARTNKRRDQADRKAFSRQGVGGEILNKLNPQRKNNLSAAVAEEQLLCALMKNPDFVVPVRRSLDAAELATDMGRRLYQMLLSCRDPSALLSEKGSELTREEAGFIGGLAARYQDINFTLEEAQALVRRLQDAKAALPGAAVAELPEEDYKTYLDKLIKGKS